jgi:hypothetical protein
MNKILNKIQKSVKQEKETVNEKPLAVTEDDEQFTKADEFFATRENKYHASNEIKSEKNKKEPSVVSTFILPKSEYKTVEETLLNFAKNNLFIKQTDVFRIALSVIKNCDFEKLLDAYNRLEKVRSRKSK